jgi:hypothetical protein
MHRQRCSKRASHCGQIYTARHAPLIRSACSTDLALCVRAGGLVSQFAEECGGASGNRVCGPQAAPRPPRGHPQPTSTPWEAGGGQPRPAECRESALWPRSGRGAAGGGGVGGVGVALHGPRRHLRGSGELRGRSGGVFRRYHPLEVGDPIWITPYTGVKHPWLPTGVLHCPVHPSCAGA